MNELITIKEQDMADDSEKGGVGVVGAIAAIGAGVGTAAGTATYGFNKLKSGIPDSANLLSAEIAEDKIKDIQAKIASHFDSEIAKKSAGAAETVAAQAAENVATKGEQIAERIVKAQQGINKANFVTRPINAFKGLGTGGKAAVIGLGAVSLLGTGMIISKLRSGSHAEQLVAERTSGKTSPAR